MNAEIPVDIIERMETVGSDIMFRLCEVDSIVKGCDALLEGARDAGEDVLASQNITALSYLLTIASEKLMEHWRFVDAEMAGLRNELGRAREACAKS
jgi:hypothetical protein